VSGETARQGVTRMFLVTGGVGFTGSRFATRLAYQGQLVRNIRNLSPRTLRVATL
jgi:nucleoside-diphosphate-sugar epimerase